MSVVRSLGSLLSGFNFFQSMTGSSPITRNSMTKEKVIIAGGGLVGALAASAFADSGHEVELFELREDPRGEEWAYFYYKHKITHLNFLSN